MLSLIYRLDINLQYHFDCYYGTFKADQGIEESRLIGL